MAKRAADTDVQGADSMKKGERPMQGHNGGVDVDFDDDFEDEFESEDEIFEAGADGQPDQGVDEESRGMWIKQLELCDP